MSVSPGGGSKYHDIENIGTSRFAILRLQSCVYLLQIDQLADTYIEPR